MESEYVVSRKCKQCGKTKPISQMAGRSWAMCKVCYSTKLRERYANDSEYRKRYREQAKQRRLKNRDRINARQRAYYANNEEYRERVKAKNKHSYRTSAEYRARSARSTRKCQLARYGMTEADYAALFEKWQGRCGICGRHQSEFPKALNVDHDHQTNKVRGLLCESCNVALGKLGDTLEAVMSAVRYLQTAEAD